MRESTFVFIYGFPLGTPCSAIEMLARSVVADDVLGVELVDFVGEKGIDRQTVKVWVKDDEAALELHHIFDGTCVSVVHGQPFSRIFVSPVPTSTTIDAEATLRVRAV